MQPQCGTKPGRCLPGDDEAEPPVEAEGVVIGGDLHPPCSSKSGGSDNVTHQGAADTLSHPIGMDEQVLDIEKLVEPSRGGECNDTAVLDGRNLRAALFDGCFFELKGVGIREEDLPVGFVPK